MFSKFCVFIYVVIFLASSCTTAEPESSKTSVIRDVISVDPLHAKTILIEGKNGDKVELRFPDEVLFAVGPKPVEVEISLTYRGAKMTGFKTDSELLFSKPVDISFKSDSLEASSLYLSFIDPNDESKNYFLPFKKEADAFVYSFEHFSEYSFLPSENQNPTIEDVEALFAKAKQVTDKSGGISALPPEIDDALHLLSILQVQAKQKDDDEAIENIVNLLNEIGVFSLSFADAFIENSVFSGQYLQGFCPHRSLQSYTRELVKNANFASSLNEDAIFSIGFQKAVDAMADGTDRYLASPTDELCKRETGLEDFLHCSQVWLLASGANPDGLYSLIQEHIPSVFAATVESAAMSDCPQACLEKILELGDDFNSEETFFRIRELLDEAPVCAVSLIATSGDSKVDLSWTATQAPTNLSVYYSQQTFGNPPNLGSGTSLSATGTQHSVTGLTNQTPYYFIVVSKKENGDEMGKSAERIATPKKKDEPIPANNGDSFDDCPQGGDATIPGCEA